MCVGIMGASKLVSRRGGWVKGRDWWIAGMAHWVRVVGVRDEWCCRRWCVAGLLWRGLGPPQEMGNGSRECTPRGRPVTAKVSPGRGT